MKWLTDDEFFGTEVGTGVNSVESGDSLRDSFASRTLIMISAIAQNSLSSLATSPDFLAKMQVAFGNSFDVEKAVKLASAWAQGDFNEFPEIEIRSEAEINGALGAFAAATGKIYLSREFLAKNAGNVTAVAGVLLEEFGHFVDSQINRVDAIGDEGEIFSDLVQGRALSQGELAGLKGEDDLAVVVLDGEVRAIEKAEVSDSGGFEGSTKTLKLDSQGGGTAKYSYEMFTIPDNLILRYEGKEILNTGFVSGSKTGTVQIPKGNSDELEVVLATNDEGTQWNYEIKTARKPVLIVPGILGSFVSPNNFNRWVDNRGLNPDELVIDPILRSYDDLIATLENAGYRRGEDLFVATYDWRLAPSPNDGSLNGIIGGLSAASISDNTFEYGVDYLGYCLRQAAEKWKERFPNDDPLESVDVIAHSTGGLVTRTYIQSDAYGGSFGDLNLPKIDNFIMVGVPNAGAPQAWNPINDDWNSNSAYKLIVRQFANVPYQKLLQGRTIAGPTPITQQTVIAQSGNSDLNSQASKEAFIDQYVPTVKSLLATYDFGAEVPPSKQNKLLQDLNAGGGVSFVVSKSNTTVIYGTNLDTITFVEPRTGKSTFFDPLQSFTEKLDRQPQDNETWWEEVETRDGDETVPVRSATFVPGKERPFVGVKHGELPANEGVQRFILETLGTQLEEGKEISTDKAVTIPRNDILSFINDPVDGFLVDSQGRRLGYSQATGAVTEIPNSIWFGDRDGIGWVFGEVDSPATLQLTGLGQDHYVQVSGVQGTQAFGIESSGFLATGEQKNLSIAATDIPQDPNTPASGGDLEVSLVANPNTVPLGGNLTYTIDIKNKGQNNSTGVVLTEYLSNGINFISANASKGQVSQANGIVSVNIGNLNSGENVTATIQVSPFVAGTLTSTANVSSTETDPNPNNDSITTSVNVSSTAPAATDLELKQTVNNPNPNVGDRITLTLTLTNKGPGVASSIKVADILPPGLSFISANSIQGTYDSSTGIWDVGNMRDNLTRTLNINAQVNTPGSIITNATLLSIGETDINPANNQASLTINTIGSGGSIPNQKVPIFGTPGNDNLVGTFEPDIIYGLTGNDIIGGIGESDTIYGNQDDDFINGNQTNDMIFGGKGNDLLLGGKGNDQIYGDIGNDTLIGGLGQDILVGGPDTDTFVLPTKAAVVNDFLGDNILDFQVGIDRIGLTDGLTFSNLILITVDNKTVIQISENRQTLGVVNGVSPSQLSNSFVSINLAGI
jgi:uncharacterized repeat protein (TIGR01451 family)